uniref:Uncharacterized protein n=1 Tax=Glossina austeni TaxID=7395 RepID=A0A1A9UYM1_GLOAU
MNQRFNQLPNGLSYSRYFCNKAKVGRLEVFVKTSVEPAQRFEIYQPSGPDEIVPQRNLIRNAGLRYERKVQSRDTHQIHISTYKYAFISVSPTCKEYKGSADQDYRIIYMSLSTRMYIHMQEHLNNLNSKQYKQ